MKRQLLCLGAVLSLMWCCGTFPCVAFVDVVKGAYYSEAVDWAVDNNITTGTSATEFSPEKPCTKSQALTFLWRLVVKNVEQKAYEKKDMEEAVEWAIIKGLEDENFDSQEVCSRADFVGYLYAINAKEPTVKKSEVDTLLRQFPDMRNTTDFVKKTVAWAVGLGITQGKKADSFDPEGTCNRAQIMTFLFRYIKRTAKGVGADA